MAKLKSISMLVLVAMLALAFAVGIGLSYKFDVPQQWILPGCIAFALVLVLIQYLVGPLLLDWILQVRWTDARELGDDFDAWNQRTCTQFRISPPRIGIIDDGMPNAFTYGHGPWNGRVILSQGLIDVLDPQELKAVYAHELGHIRNRDFIVMTLVQAVVLVLYCFARSSRGSSKDRLTMMLAAYAAYWISYYVSLLLSRVREYMADYASAQILQDPNALSRALVKISYGLAQTQLPASKQPVQAPGSPVTQPTSSAAHGALSVANAKDKAELVMMQMKLSEKNAPDKLKEQEQKAEQRRRIMHSLGSFGIASAASMRSAVAWFSPTSGDLPSNFAIAARWELYNTWARVAEFMSTHPLTANRIKALQKLNNTWGLENAFDFSKIQPGRYRGFVRDLLIMVLPILGLIGGGIASLSVLDSQPVGIRIGLPIVAFFTLGLVSTMFKYKTETPARYRVLTLLGTLDVSHITPKYVVLEGRFTGLLGAGFAWANDYILQDETGYLACLYQQPFAFWEWAHGLFRAQQNLGRPVRVHGWYRRFSAPYLEIERIEFLDTRETTRCWFLVWSVMWQLIGLVVGAALIGLLK